MKGLWNVLPRIIGILSIIIVMNMIPNVVTANANTTGANLTNLIGLSTIASFGTLLIIFGFVFSGATMAVWGGGMSSARGDKLGVASIITSVVTVIGVIIGLNMFGQAIPSANTAIQACIDASDTLTQLGIGILYLLVYLAIVASPWTAGVITAVRHHKNKKGKGATKGAPAYQGL